jgi:hypothetical protein
VSFAAPPSKKSRPLLRNRESGDALIGLPEVGRLLWNEIESPFAPGEPVENEQKVVDAVDELDQVLMRERAVTGALGADQPLSVRPAIPR